MKTDNLPGKAPDEEPCTALRLEPKDKQVYLLSWLSAKPAQMRALASMELDPQKRFDTVLSALLKERSANVIPFKKSRK